MEQVVTKATRSQKVEAISWTAAVILTWLVIGSLLLASHRESFLLIAIGGLYLAAGIALPTMLLIDRKRGKARTPITRARDRVTFTLIIALFIALGLGSPALLHLFIG